MIRDKNEFVENSRFDKCQKIALIYEFILKELNIKFFHYKVNKQPWTPLKYVPKIIDNLSVNNYLLIIYNLIFKNLNAVSIPNRPNLLHLKYIFFNFLYSTSFLLI